MYKARDKSEWAANILVGEHAGLECDGQTRVNRFTSNHTHHFARQIRLGKYDGYHMYSQDGVEALTASMLHILQTAGMVRQRGPVQHPAARKQNETEPARQPGQQTENYLQASRAGASWPTPGRPPGSRQASSRLRPTTCSWIFSKSGRCP